MKNIVIVGAGFGGLQAALYLDRVFGKDKSVQVTIVDKRDYHLFTSNLYEVASSEEELTTVSQMKKSITLPVRGVLARTKIKFLQSEIKEILTKEKKLLLAAQQISYDYLILALGSQSDFFNIPGAEKYSLLLKTLPDALRIRNQVEFMVQAHKFDSAKKSLRLVIAGGGYTGLELAAELKGLVDILAWKYGYPREKIEIEVIEAANKLIPGFSTRLSDDAYERLQDLDIRVSLSSRISGVDQHFVELMSGEKVSYDLLIWTTGVKACAMPTKEFSLDGKGRIPVNEFLQSQTHPEIFAVGDNACVMDAKGRPAPATAQDAWDQAKYLAYALPYIIKNQKPPAVYLPKKHGFIVTLGGKWAIMDYGGIYLKGYLAYVVDQFAHIRYYMSVVGLWKALKYVLFQVEMYGRND